MAFCSKCGKELPAGATFCPYCATPVEPGAAASASSQAAPRSGFDSLFKDSMAQEYWAKRLFAFVIDAVIVYVVVFILFVILAAIVSIPFAIAGVASPFNLVFGRFPLIGGIVFVLYFTVAESSNGTSIGKSVFGLRVRTRAGSTPTLGEAFVRNLSKIWWPLLLLDVIIGLALSKSYQQKYADFFMGTSVVPKAVQV
jgi:uncharacterized RDD family membrane protein YckC